MLAVYVSRMRNSSSGRPEIIALGEWVREWKEGERKIVMG